MDDIRILSPDEVRSLSPEQRREYFQSVGKAVIKENRETIAILAAHDDGEAVKANPEARTV